MKYQSSDELVGDPNPVEKLLAQGSATITASSPGGGVEYYYGSAVIDLSDLDYAVTVPEAIVHVRGSAGDGSTTYSKAPYTIPRTTLTDSGGMEISQHVGYSLQRGTAKGSSYELRLVIGFYSITNGAEVTVDYKVKTFVAAPFDSN